MENRTTEYDLSPIETEALVTELMHRDGVETTTLAPDVFADVKATGPAIVLVVID